jgi:hypothetical protein
MPALYPFVISFLRDVLIHPQAPTSQQPCGTPIFQTRVSSSSCLKDRSGTSLHRKDHIQMRYVCRRLDSCECKIAATLGEQGGECT